MKFLFLFLVTGGCRFSVVLSVVCAAGFLLSAVAEEVENKIEPRAGELLRDLADFYRSLDAFRVEVWIEEFMQRDADGEVNEWEDPVRFAVFTAKRPNFFLYDFLLPNFSRSFLLCDGNYVYSYLFFVDEDGQSKVNHYTVDLADRTFDGLVRYLPPMGGVSQNPNQLFFCELLREYPWEIIMEGIVAAEYIGEETLDGVECHRLRTLRKDRPQDVWIAKGERPLLMQVQPDMSVLLEKALERTRKTEEAGQGVSEYPNQEERVVLRYLNWEISPQLSDEAFVFTAPEGSEKVERYFEQTRENYLEKEIKEAEKFLESLSHAEIIKRLEEEEDPPDVDVEKLRSMSLEDTRKALIEKFREEELQELHENATRRPVVFEISGTKGLPFIGRIWTDGGEVQVSGAVPANFRVGGNMISGRFWKTRAKGKLQVVLRPNGGGSSGWSSSDPFAGSPDFWQRRGGFGSYGFAGGFGISISDFTHLLSNEEKGEEESAPLLGGEAPEFELNLLGGGKLNLAEHRGKRVVILDFWATWCGPCVDALPSLAKIAEEYRSKDVILYAVNLQERPRGIERFLQRQKLNLTVALDLEGKVGYLYQVTSIPQTVLIGKNGKVEALHIGFGEDSERRLRSELDALIAGKSLVEEEKKAEE